jgi:hypothetical protein
MKTLNNQHPIFFFLLLPILLLFFVIHSTHAATLTTHFVITTPADVDMSKPGRYDATDVQPKIDKFGSTAFGEITENQLNRQYLFQGETYSVVAKSKSLLNPIISYRVTLPDVAAQPGSFCYIAIKKFPFLPAIVNIKNNLAALCSSIASGDTVTITVDGNPRLYTDHANR